jgi:hypothetical protein
MRNPGGLLLFCEGVLQRVMPAPFHTMGFEIRATATWLTSFANTLEAAQRAAFTAAILALIQGGS